MGGWVDGWMSGWMDGWMDGWMSGLVIRWMGGWLDGWMDGWMMGGWLDGWMDDGWVGFIPILLFLVLDFQDHNQFLWMFKIFVLLAKDLIESAGKLMEPGRILKLGMCDTTK